MQLASKMLCKRSAQQGFTLIELVVTVSIATILLTIAVPSMVNLVRDARLSTDADGLVVALNMARSEAIKQRTNFSVCPSSAPNTATTCTADASVWSTGWLSVGNGAVSQRNVAKSGMTVSTTSTGVTFNGTLGSATAAGTFTLCVAGRKQQIVEVAMSGHVSKRIGTATCS